MIASPAASAARWATSSSALREALMRRHRLSFGDHKTCAIGIERNALIIRRVKKQSECSLSQCFRFAAKPLSAASFPATALVKIAVDGHDCQPLPLGEFPYRAIVGTCQPDVA